MNTKIPILILAYNRPDLVVQVMQVVREYQPSRLYLACDGPRANKQGDADAVAQTRQMMCQMITWECDVKYLFREVNHGCAQGVYEAITWFFDNEEYGVILEDDVLVCQDFFKMCEDLLPRYANDERIMQISSRNTSGRLDIHNSYVYTQVFHCWGWASWRRAWQQMDMSMSGVEKLSIPYLVKRLGAFRGCLLYYKFKDMYSHLEQSTSWATRWYLSVLVHDGLVICPGVNLGVNIGLAEGEHYSEKDANRPDALVRMGVFEWPIEYNDSMLIDKKQKKSDSKFFLKDKLYGLVHKFI